MTPIEFLIELWIIAFPIILSTMMFSYGICRNNVKVSAYNLISNSIIGSCLVYYMSYHLLAVEFQFIIMLLMTIFLFKISSDLSMTESIKAVVVSFFVTIIIQFIIATVIVLFKNVDYSILRTDKFYSLFGSVSTSILVWAIGFKLYLIKLKEVEKYVKKS